MEACDMEDHGCEGSTRSALGRCSNIFDIDWVYCWPLHWGLPC